jgi:hypothetical protein
MALCSKPDERCGRVDYVEVVSSYCRVVLQKGDQV